MLQIKDISKEYRTENLVQKALDHVSLNFRDNEFVAILGPSGSGKTTLLNVIGGLDRYDSGDLIINGVSTKKYKDKDWDSYRNHTIGFVFQSYNLIPHQTILANVELALTISGIGKSERTKRAQEALSLVGLGAQAHKKPNQLSGGQMQRVAIARALVNNPDILLADEPTGALDSDTSVQVMDLLKEVAKDRLVIMVTHNPELAGEYATRIVQLKDGRILSDSDPLEVDSRKLAEPQHKNMGRSSMAFLTALTLSFNNLKTKKARTLLTSFAGSIGIIGIALILSISNGVQDYIQNMEEQTLTRYPLSIESEGFDLMSMMEDAMSGSRDEKNGGDVNIIQTVSNMFSKVSSNDLKSLKQYFDSDGGDISKYTNAIEYKYDITPQIFSQDSDYVRQVNPNASFENLNNGSAGMMMSMMGGDVFYEMPDTPSLYEDQYSVKAGRWPEKYNECVVVLTGDGGVSDMMLYTLGLRDPVELDDMIGEYLAGKSIKVPDDLGTYSYDDFVGIKFKLVNSSDFYSYDSKYGIWTDQTDNEDYMKKLVNKGENLTVVGVVQPVSEDDPASLSSGIGYLPSLTEYVINQSAGSRIVRQQLQNPDKDVFSGEEFGKENKESSFDFSKLFTVDEGALANAFQFDESKLSEGMDNIKGIQDLPDGTADLSGMIDPNSLNLSEVPALDMKKLMGNLDLTVSQDGINTLAGKLLSGYQQYAASHPQADISTIRDSFLAYLETESAQQIISKNIMEILQSGGVSLTADDLRSLIESVMKGFMEYAAANGKTDPDHFDEYLTEYLQTPDAQAILNQWIGSLSGSLENVQVSSGQIQKLGSGLLDGYESYARENGVPGLEQMSSYFTEYLNSPEAQKIIASGMSDIINTDNLSDQLQKAMNEYTSTVSDTIEKQISSVMQQMMKQISAGMTEAMNQAMSQIGKNMKDAVTVDPSVLQKAFSMSIDPDQLTDVLMSLGSTEDASYDTNLEKLGYADTDQPSSIQIYPKDFTSKEQVTKILDQYNTQMKQSGEKDKEITYTDSVGTLMSSVTEIIDIISYVLIAFVAISLLVSSIMIGVITYISVLERRKEIGILRAIGASKRNVSQVFNAETFIIGACAGILGIGLTLILLIPANVLLHRFTGMNDVRAFLPIWDALILIGLSILLTLIGGLLPSRKAAKNDPVTALRVD